MEHYSVSQNFIQANLNSIRNIKIEHKENYSDVTFSIDQTNLSSVGICFLTFCHKQYIRPLVKNAKIIDSKNINPSYFYLGNLLQEQIDTQITNSALDNNLTTFVKVTTIDLNHITKLYGMVQVIEVTIRF